MLGFRPEIRIFPDRFYSHFAEFRFAVAGSGAPFKMREEIMDVFRAPEALDRFRRSDCGESFKVMAFDAFLPPLPDPFAIIEFSASRSELDVAGGDVFPS